ncbi:MAG: hypothetical protein WBG92_20750, partial [Thiohalocapsa sp.]
MTTTRISAPTEPHTTPLRSSGSRLPGYALLLAATAALACNALFGDQAALAQDSASNACGGTQPCFADIPDILGGRRNLLPNDDLVLGINLEGDDESKTVFLNVYLPTKDLNVILPPTDPSLSEDPLLRLVEAPCITR